MKERVIELIAEVLDVPEGAVTETSGRYSVAGGTRAPSSTWASRSKRRSRSNRSPKSSWACRA